MEKCHCCAKSFALIFLTTLLGNLETVKKKQKASIDRGKIRHVLKKDNG